MVRTVLTFPDKVLKEVSRPVTAFNHELGTLLDDMFDTMMEQNGVGLAAIQIGVEQRAIVICIPDEEGSQNPDDRLEIINPELIHGEGSTLYQEGCLSVPDYYEDVERFERVIVRYQDRHGTLQEQSADGLLAIAFQHEMDHLDGKLFVERLPLLKRKKFEKEWKKRLRG